MGAQGVHLGGSLLVKGAEERKEEAVLVEPSRPSAWVDHALLQPSPHVGVLGLEIADWPGWMIAAALGMLAAHGAVDGHQDLQNLRLQMPRDLSWLGGCLAPPCRGLRPTPALCAPSRGCDEPVARHCLPRSADEVRAVRRG